MNIKNTIEEVRVILPNIRPLTEFLHLNMFPGLTNKNFWESMKITAEKYSFLPFSNIDFYQEKLKNGDIDQKILQKVANEVFPELSEEEYLKFINRPLKRIGLSEKSFRPLTYLINERIDNSITELTEPLLIRFLSNFFDQGIAFWDLPLRDQGLMDCFFNLVTNSYVDFYPLTKKMAIEYESKTSEQVISIILSKLFESENLKEFFIQESLLSLKGWTGMISCLEKEPELLLDKRKAKLEDFLAVKLIIEWAWIKKFNSNFQKITEVEFNKIVNTRVDLINKDDWNIYYIWHEAYERSLHQKIFSEMNNFFTKNNPAEHEYEVQALFCIDDRECSLRRFIENYSEKIQTFGTPGHFGLDFYYKESFSTYPKKHCPAPVVANHILIPKNNIELKTSKVFNWHQDQSQNVIKELFLTLFTGIFAGFKLIYSIFNFKNIEASPSKIIENPNPLKVFNLNNETFDNKKEGYTYLEAATRLSQVFATIGLKKYAKLIFVIGHGAKTTNNPYFSAYGCGACSGREGWVNSNVFCEMANLVEVRQILKEKFNINIPESTKFIASYHDTCAEEISFFDIGNLSHIQQNAFNLFYDAINRAIKQNSKLRAKDFELISKEIGEVEALVELRKRSIQIFEPRPELGHTNNAFCIVAPREITRDFNFQRRAFLQSYDNVGDISGSLLNAILSAAIPVCGGINLDYFYSKLNNRGIGAGSKLSQNVIGLFSLANGTEDDLLTGLAYQMIELHDPVRIMFIIYQNPQLVLEVLKNNANIWSWVKNDWVKVACINPDDKSFFVFKNEKFILAKDYL